MSSSCFARWLVLGIALLAPTALAAQQVGGTDALPASAPATARTPVAPVPSVVSYDADGRLVIRATRLREGVILDGRLDDPLYSAIPAITGFVQQEPREGEPATEQTEVWVLFDDRHVYVAARCWDSQPERMVANDVRRDGQNIFQNENFGVIFDTFHDRRNGMQFYTNPLAGLADSLITDESNSNRDWNTVWDVRTGRFDGGWTVEMAIPFASLRYAPGDTQTWGINFRRIVRWKNETSYLTAIPASAGPRGLMRLSLAATLVGVEPPSGTKNLEIKPYLISGLQTDRDADPVVSNDWTRNAGFDMKYGFARGLVADFTVNTDFAQVEDDEQQVNLTRFSLFFPEKREFFLEGQGIFAFGGVNVDSRGFRPPSDAPILFFSRQIGLQDGTTVPIRGGARVTGRTGAFSIGALNIQSGESAAAGALATNFSVVRIKRDVLRRSNVGVIATHRSVGADGPGANSVYGLDGNFAFFDALNLNAFYARSVTPGADGNDASYYGNLNYDGDRYGVELQHVTIQENFSPGLGFVRREDIRKNGAQLRFSPRPKNLPGVRKLSYEASLDYFTDNDGTLQTRDVQGRFGAELENGDRLNVSYERTAEVLDEPFDITDDVTLPVGAYHFQAVRGSYNMGPQRRLSGWINAGRGSFYSGTKTDVGYMGRLEISSRLIVEPRASVNWVDLPEGAFTTSLLGSRLNVMVSPRTLFSTLLQYNSSAESVSANVRFKWEFQPGSDLFVVYSEGRNTLRRGFPELENRSFVVKMTRLIRF